MENNTSTYYHDGSENAKNIISYQFKSNVTICSNTTETSEELQNRNSGLVSENVSKSIDKRITTLLEKCQDKYEEIFCSTMIDEYIEDGYISNSHKMYSIIVGEYGDMVAGMFLNEIYKKYALNNKIIKSLLFIMGNLEPKKLKGAEEAILAYALMNKDYEIRDLALQCYEKWNDKKYLNLLKSMSFDVDFLQKYLNNIVSELEREL